MKQGMIDLLAPATVALALLFWANAPPALVDSAWTLPVIGVATMALVQLLELVIPRHDEWRTSWREVATDVFYVVFNMTAVGWAATTLADDPLTAAKTALGIATPGLAALPFLVQVALVVVLVEIGQYAIHRGMHNSALLWSVHAPHHHLTQLNAMKGYVGNPIELFLISLSVIALFDFDTAAILASFNVMGAIAVFSHANLRSNPPGWFAFFFTTIRHHSLHHNALSYEDTRCNYATTLIVIDRLFGTYRDGEAAVVGQGERRRLSIIDQFAFPFRAWSDRMRAGRGTASG